jgi:hypothetical protein
MLSHTNLEVSWLITIVIYPHIFGEIVDAVRNNLSVGESGEVVVKGLERSVGQRFPLTLKFPSLSFFLVSMLIMGSPMASASSRMDAMRPNCSSLFLTSFRGGPYRRNAPEV